MIYHTPVLFKEILEILVHNPTGTYIDCTMGEGGHTQGILSKIGQTGQVISLDQDTEMIEKAKIRFASVSNWQCIHTNFRDIQSSLAQKHITQVDGILADLGLSMFHYKASSKGFSFSRDDILSMSLSGVGENAADIVNTYSEQELKEIFWKYGEEQHAHRIASFILFYRENVRLIKTTKELADIIYKAIRSLPSYKPNKIHPATKVFQALRIVVNKELESLEILLEKSLSLIKSGGVVMFLTYHSLEDRIIKEFTQLHKEKFKNFSKKPIIPTEGEIEKNKAARSAKLRFFILK